MNDDFAPIFDITSTMAVACGDFMPMLGSSFGFPRHGSVDAQDSSQIEHRSFSASSLLMGSYNRGANQLWLRQQPEKSRVVVKGREKGRSLVLNRP